VVPDLGVAGDDRAGGVTMLGVRALGPTPPGPSDAPGDPADPRQAERDAWAILAGVDGLGPVGFAALLARFGSGAQVLRVAASPNGIGVLADSPGAGDPEAAPDGRRRRPVSVALATAIAVAADRGDATLERIRGLGLQVVTVDDGAYPGRLGAIDLPPHLLFVLGDIAALQAPHAVAVVGTRRPTERGRAVAARIGAALAAAGAAVVSGLAVGIDGAAHDAALTAGGTTVAVIGGGHAALYPRAHAALADAIVASGGAIVSELAPDAASTKGTFPRRNRVISGLSDATVVVEAPARSGALITASWALEQGRDCYLVPGPIDARESAGCLAFLREFHDGARIVAGIPQLIDDLGLVQRRPEAPLAAATMIGLGSAARQVADGLVGGLVTVDELVAVTQLPVATVLASLTILERQGLAVGVHGRYRVAGTLAAAP